MAATDAEFGLLWRLISRDSMHFRSWNFGELTQYKIFIGDDKKKNTLIWVTSFYEKVKKRAMLHVVIFALYVVHIVTRYSETTTFDFNKFTKENSWLLHTTLDRTTKRNVSCSNFEPIFFRRKVKLDFCPVIEQYQITQ